MVYRGNDLRTDVHAIPFQEQQLLIENKKTIVLDPHALRQRLRPSRHVQQNILL